MPGGLGPSVSRNHTLYNCVTWTQNGYSAGLDRLPTGVGRWGPKSGLTEEGLAWVTEDLDRVRGLQGNLREELREARGSKPEWGQLGKG